MFDITVERRGRYKEISVSHGYPSRGLTGQLFSGLLDEKEAVAMAIEFISAAEDLLTEDVHIEALAIVREKLDT